MGTRTRGHESNLPSMHLDVGAIGGKAREVGDIVISSS